MFLRSFVNGANTKSTIQTIRIDWNVSTILMESTMEFPKKMPETLRVVYYEVITMAHCHEIRPLEKLPVSLSLSLSLYSTYY